MKSNRLFRLVLLALLGTPAIGAGQDISIQLLFDGKPLRTTAEPDFSCLDVTPHVWIACHITREAATDGYVMVKPPPGTYTLHVEIDENKKNPGRFPGDYDAFHRFEVTADGPALLRVDVPKLMRLRSPWDNNTSVDGLLTKPLSEKPAFETPRRSRSGTANISFRWNAVVRGAEYTYVILNVRDSPYERVGEVLRGKTRRTSITLRLPRSEAGHYFEFVFSAHKGGRQVGDFITHDAGVQAWKTEFVVRDWSGQPTIDIAARAAQRRMDDQGSASNAAFLADWTRAVPKPVWWDSVPRTALAINSLGDLMALWHSDTSDEGARRRFYKLAYQGILDHPGDEHLVAMAINLMAFIGDSEDRFPLLKFGVDHFFSYNQRTDNCANCIIGDQAGEMVRDLAAAYISRGEPEAAIQIIQRLVDERESEVSAYNLALTFETMSRAYWEMKDVNAAKAAIQEGLRRFPSGWQADRLRQTLDRYEKASDQTIEPR